MRDIMALLLDSALISGGLSLLTGLLFFFKGNPFLLFLYKLQGFQKVIGLLALVGGIFWLGLHLLNGEKIWIFEITGIAMAYILLTQETSKQEDKLIPIGSPSIKMLLHIVLGLFAILMGLYGLTLPNG